MTDPKPEDKIQRTQPSQPNSGAADAAPLVRAPRRSAVLCVVALIIVWFAQGWQQFQSLNWAQQTARFIMSPDNVDLDSVVIAIDTASLRALPDWPWPRDRYGEIVDRLNDAGAKQIAFDIDFSARREGDEAFAAAIERSSVPVYTVAYRQEFDNLPGVYAEVWPNPVIEEVAQTASTNFPIDADGRVRRLPAEEIFSDGALPQLAFALSGHERYDGLRGLDFAQSLPAIPVVSFSDVLAGADISDLVNGKTVFIGATALELGDEFAMPRFGFQSGVLLNVLAYETLLHESEKTLWPEWIGLVFLAISLAVASLSVTTLGLRNYMVINLTVYLTLALTGTLFQDAFDILIPTATAHLVHAFGMAAMLIGAAESYAGQVYRSRMNIEKHARVLDAMMASNNDGIILLNRFGNVESANERAADLIGAAGKNLQDVHLPDVAPILTGVQPGHPPVVLEFETPDGALRYLEASSAKVTLPMSRSRYEKRKTVRHLTIYTLHDLTLQKLAEQAERDAKEMHEQASAAKSTLISTMSHELRTPLNAVCGFADLIADSAFGEHAVPEYAEFGEMIRSGGKQLLGVVNDMLLAARLQSKEVTLSTKEFTVDQAVQSALTRAKLRQSWTDPEIVIDTGSAKIKGDYDLTVTALYHLLDNGSKFAGAKGTIWISADPETGAIIVEDNGPGPGDADLEGIKQLFQQGDGSAKRSYEGCGLGLFLVDQVAQLHGGTIDLGARDGGGFSARLHLDKEHWVAVTPAAAA